MKSIHEFSGCRSPRQWRHCLSNQSLQGEPLIIAGKARTDVYVYTGPSPRFSDPNVGELWSNRLHATMVLRAPRSMI